MQTDGERAIFRVWARSMDVESIDLKAWIKRKKASIKLSCESRFFFKTSKLQNGCFEGCGNEKCFRLYNLAITEALSASVVSWKRADSVASPYPLTIRFRAEFVAHTDALILAPATPQRCTNVALVHAFFLNAAVSKRATFFVRRARFRVSKSIAQYFPIWSTGLRA